MCSTVHYNTNFVQCYESGVVFERLFVAIKVERLNGINDVGDRRTTYYEMFLRPSFLYCSFERSILVSLKPSLNKDYNRTAFLLLQLWIRVYLQYHVRETLDAHTRNLTPDCMQWQIQRDDHPSRKRG